MTHKERMDEYKHYLHLPVAKQQGQISTKISLGQMLEDLMILDAMLAEAGLYPKEVVPTEGPFRFGRYATGWPFPAPSEQGPIRIWAKNGRCIADLPATKQGEEDARFIVDACNKS